MNHDPNIVYAEFDSPQGKLYLAATPRGLAGMWFTDQRHLPDVTSWQCVGKDADKNVQQNAQKNIQTAAQQRVLIDAIAQLQTYFAGKLQAFDLPLDLSAGTAFQQSVWQGLLKIPFGTTTSYGALSSSIGKPMAVRAVGTAIGRNPIGIIVPCHRVIGADGSLTGYAGGLHRKEVFLKLEGALPAVAQTRQATLL